MFTVTESMFKNVSRVYIDVGSLLFTVEKWNEVSKHWMEIASIGQSFFIFILSLWRDKCHSMIQRLSDMFLLAETLPQEPEIVKSGRFFDGKVHFSDL